MQGRRTGYRAMLARQASCDFDHNNNKIIAFNSQANFFPDPLAQALAAGSLEERNRLEIQRLEQCCQADPLLPNSNWKRRAPQATGEHSPQKKKKNYNHPRCHQIGPVVITYIQTQWSRSHLSRVGSAQVVSDKEMLGSATTQLQYQTNANNRNLSAAVRTSVAPESGESIARNLHSLKELLTTVGGKGKRP